MRASRGFVLAASALALAGAAAWLWLGHDRSRLLAPDLSFRHDPKLRIVHVLDVRPRSLSTEYSLFGDGRLSVEVWEHVAYSSFFRQGKQLQSLGYLSPSRSRPRQLRAAESRLSGAQHDRLWRDLARSGVLGLENNLLIYQLRRFGERHREPVEVVADGPPPPSIEVEIDSGVRRAGFNATYFRELAELYPELPALAGAVRLLDRLAAYGLGASDAGRAEAGAARSTGQIESTPN